VPKPPARCSCAVWDTCNAEVFLLAAVGGALQVYRYEAQSTHGPRVVRLAMGAHSLSDDPIETPGEYRLAEDSCAALSCQPPAADTDPMGHQLRSGQPLLCRNGVLTFCGDDGQPRHGVLSTHSALQVPRWALQRDGCGRLLRCTASHVFLRHHTAPTLQFCDRQLQSGAVTAHVRWDRCTCRQEPDALAAAGAGHLRLRFQQALALGQLPAAWAAAAMLVERDVWRALGDAALHALDVGLAIRCLTSLLPFLLSSSACLPNHGSCNIARLHSEPKPHSTCELVLISCDDALP